MRVPERTLKDCLSLLSSFTTTRVTAHSWLIHTNMPSVYEHVRWKKQAGTLQLGVTDGIAFRSEMSAGLTIPWSRIAKHQVSPANYPKALLKLVLKDGSNTTFQLPDRPSLEKLRKEISQCIQQQQQIAAASTSMEQPQHIGTKRPLPQSSTLASHKKQAINKDASYGDLDPTDLAVTRATLLAAHPNLRQQHHHLVTETNTVSEADFWKTHQDLLEEEYARMSGVAKAGRTSLLQSHVPSAGKVTLGVEEMRQIFILYPAVHKAYEEKVPLSLSDEEFWRKYLESEYFHRDRGRMGTAARNHQGGAAEKSADGQKDHANKDGTTNNGGPSLEEQDARAAAVSADDLFSRYEQKLLEAKEAANAEKESGRRQWGTKLAVGQFDLSQTFETERGKLLEGPRDNHPPNQVDDGKGAKVIQKFNRHWAMVLHPDEAVAGSDLMQVARKSVQDSIADDDDAQARGGLHQEMRQLTEFASASNENANHASCLGVREGDNYATLFLNNVEVYHGDNNSQKKSNRKGAPVETEAALAKRHADFAKVMAAKAHALAEAERNRTVQGILPAEECFPEPQLGRELLKALTNKMAQNAQTEAESLEMVNSLPDDFRNRLQTYFRRSSELLRHFFGLRRLEEEHRHSGNGKGFSQKIEKINSAMANFYREMEAMRRELPQTETGEMMRKMCLPIMDSMDWAFKLHRDGSSNGGGGGFVDVGGGFVNVSGGGFVDVNDMQQ